MKMALRRINKEIQELTTLQIPGCSVDVSDVFQWIVSFTGPQGTVFADKMHKFEIVFTEKYPFVAPTVKFIGAFYHPNISPSGKICMEVLDTKWSPAVKIYKLVEEIYSLFLAPNLTEFLNAEAANTWDTPEFAKKLNSVFSLV